MNWLAETAMLSYGWRRFLLLIATGAVAGLSIPPLFVAPALFVSFPVWVWCLDGAEPGRSWRRLFGSAFRIGFAFGWGYFTVAFHWIGAAFFVDGGIMIALMPFAVLALAASIAFFWGVASALAHLLWSDSPWRIVTLATLLASAEWARGHMFTGFPFDLLGYALTLSDEMMQIVSVIGIYGMTLVVALLAMVPAVIWPAGGRRLGRRLLPVVTAAVVVAGIFGFGYARIAGTAVVERSDLAMRMVQPMVREHADWASADPVALLDRLLMLSDVRTDPSDGGLADVTHLVWPESSLPFFLSAYPEALTRIAQLLPDGAMLLTGAARQQYELPGSRSSGPAFNSLLAVDTDGEVVASYDKSHLVPFGEYLPLAEFFSWLGIKQFVPGADGWARGDVRGRLMSLPNAPPFLALICYEVLFSGGLGDTGGAQFLLDITNDGWFDGSIGPAQHAQHARVRAVEEGMSLVRAANTGLTFATDPLGRITGEITPLQMGVLDVTPYERLPSTIFSQLRYWPLLLALLAGLSISIVVSPSRYCKRTRKAKIYARESA